jgi:4-amino-4-deoxy-L-arabinose transferase-like glycosyltransferase
MSTWRTYGHTWDEPEHLAAGIELLDTGRYDYDVQHPPLGRLLIALGPYLAGARSTGMPPPDGTPEGVGILYGGGHYDLYLTLARVGTLPFLAVLLTAMWFWARRVAETSPEAVLGVLLLAAIPPVIGHAALATLDVPAAALTLWALYLLELWMERTDWWHAISFGVVAGLAMATKLSSVPFLAVGFLVMGSTRLALTRFRDRPSPTALTTPAVAWSRLILPLATAGLVSVAVVVIAYGGRFVNLSEASVRYGPTLSALFGAQGWFHELAYSTLAHCRFPEGLLKLADGVRAVEWHNRQGHLSFLLGDVRKNGWWYFYVVALAAKTPLPLLATGPIGLALLARDGWRARTPWKIAAPALFIALLVCASLISHINIGIRHILIVYPFLALGGCHALARAWRRVRTVKNRDWAGIGASVAVGLAAWQVSGLWTANPDYLPYFNEAVAHPERVLVDSDLAWGQDLRRLERRLSDLRVPSFSFAYLGTADLARESLPPLSRLMPGQPASGWVAITELARVHALDGYAWLSAYTPIERIGKSISLYYIPDTTIGVTAAGA